MENLGVISASKYGFVDASAVSSAYNIAIEYRGVNSIKDYGYKPYVRDGDYIYFGEYPQTIKADDVTITDTTDSRGYYLGSDGCYYACILADLNNINSKPKFSTGATITDGKAYYFKVEPIRWRILSEENGVAFILCDSIIAGCRFDDDSNNYAESEIRAWLNSTFYETAFSERARSLILTTLVDNSLASTTNSSNPYICENTKDKIFLLSQKEATNSAYGFASSSTYDTARRMLTSDYSRATGVFTEAKSEFYGLGPWWLRSPYYDHSKYTYYVYGAGGIAQEYSDFSLVSVVPALRITL